VHTPLEQVTFLVLALEIVNAACAAVASAHVNVPIHNSVRAGMRFPPIGSCQVITTGGHDITTAQSSDPVAAEKMFERKIEARKPLSEVVGLSRDRCRTPTAFVHGK